ncbi:MAG: ABC transporter ATP-binding protein [Planctomycetaceae bacterium]
MPDRILRSGTQYQRIAGGNRMIDVQDVIKIHKRGQLEVHALRGVSCQISQGSFTFILGPSGSGKSTLLYLLGALDEPTSGVISVSGTPLGKMTSGERDRFRREEVGFIFQSFNLLANLSAVDNALVPFLPRGVTPEQRREAVDLLSRLGLKDRLTHRPNQLSGGEQQRVAIARALLKKPKLVLADEPTGELDTENGAAIMADLRTLCREHQSTVVVVTHEQEHVQPGDSLIRIRDGKVDSGKR